MRKFLKNVPSALVPFSALLATSCRQVIYLQIHFGKIPRGIFEYFSLFFHIPDKLYSFFAFRLHLFFCLCFDIKMS